MHHYGRRSADVEPGIENPFGDALADEVADQSVQGGKNSGIFARPETTRRQNTEDLLWALLNTPEFFFQR